MGIQLKASTRCLFESKYIAYDLDVGTYNALIERSSLRYSIPCILILKVLPQEPKQWTIVSEDGLLLSGGCYWKYIQGKVSSNKETIRIRLSREQLLTPRSLSKMLESVGTEEWPCWK